MGRELTMKLCAGWYLGFSFLRARGSLRLQRQAAADRRLLKGATFEPPPDQQAAEADPFLRSWRRGQGLYCSNGSLIGIMKRSSPDVLEPDLYIFGIPGEFRGYKPGYSKLFERFRNRFTWVILKAYTNNAAGRVLLRSDDPRETRRTSNFGISTRAATAWLRALCRLIVLALLQAFATRSALKSAS